MTSFQSSELTELPVVENSQLFAQRVHSARYAPLFTAVASCHAGKKGVKNRGPVLRLNKKLCIARTPHAKASPVHQQHCP